MERNNNQILRSMNLLPSLVSVIFFVYCTKASWTTEYGIANEFGKLHWNQRLRFTYLQFHPRTLLECVKECLTRRWRCMSINYSNQMTFCELNYINMTSEVVPENSTSFLYSDISTWSKDLTGKCRDINCNENEICSMKTGKCSLSDCGKINFDIPTNTLLQNYGHHSIGNDVDFVCDKGFMMFNKDITERVYDGVVRCNDFGNWEDVEFRCIETCKGNLLVIDKNANMKQSSSPLTNMTYLFSCNSGYKAYSKEGKPLKEPIVVKCDQDTGEWKGSDFFCKRPRTLVEDFCPSKFHYDNATNLCYVHYHLPSSIQSASAQHQCYEDHAHLLVLTKQNMNFFQPLKDELIFVDGIWFSDKTWKGWANQDLLYNDTQQWTDLKPDNENKCIAMKGQTPVSVGCDRVTDFICQFELCPESYGYTYDDSSDTCFKNYPAKFYTNDMCTPITFWENRHDITSNYFKPSVMSSSAENKELFKVFLHHNEKEFRGRQAYLMSTDSTKVLQAKKNCYSKGLEIANLQTDENKDAAVLAVNNREKHVIVGLKLSIPKTYTYRNGTGTSEDWFLQAGYLLNTDSNKCLRLLNYSDFQSFDCNKKSRFICYGETGYTLSDGIDTFANAARDCEAQGKELLEFPLTKVQRNKLIIELKMDLKRQKEWYYTGMVLYKRNYTYDWYVGEGVVMADSDQFFITYPNSFRDEHKFVVLTTLTKKFQLTSKTFRHFYLCQTRQEAAWTNCEIQNGRATAVNLKAYTTVQVDTRNNLPFICEIDINYIISQLQLFRGKIIYS